MVDDLEQVARPIIPGVGRSRLSLGLIVGLVSGLTLIAMLWGYAVSWGAKLRGYANGMVGGYLPQFGVAPAAAIQVSERAYH